MYCFKCGKEIDDNVKFCPYCGKSQLNDIDNVIIENKKDIIKYNNIDNFDTEKASNKRNKNIIIISACAVCIIVGLAFGGYYLKSSLDNKNSVIEQSDTNLTEENNDIISTQEFVSENNEDVLQQEDVQEKAPQVQDEAVNQQPIVYEEPVTYTPQISAIRQQVQSELSNLEQQTITIDNNFYNCQSTLEYNQNSSKLFQLWDDYINVLWGYLKNNLSESEFNALKQEQIDWIVAKEKAIEEAGNYDGSGRILDMNMTGFEWTKQRVYELVEYLP